MWEQVHSWHDVGTNAISMSFCSGFWLQVIFLYSSWWSLTWFSGGGSHDVVGGVWPSFLVVAHSMQLVESDTLFWWWLTRCRWWSLTQFSGGGSLDVAGGGLDVAGGVWPTFLVVAHSIIDGSGIHSDRVSVSNDAWHCLLIFLFLFLSLTILLFSIIQFLEHCPTFSEA